MKPPQAYRIKDMPQASRPRERLCEYGAAALSDVELVAILLGTGTKGLNVLELAQRLLLLSKGPAGIFAMDIATLQEEPGVGLATAARFVAAAELAKRAHYGFLDKKVESLGDIAKLVCPFLRDLLEVRCILVVMNGSFFVKDLVKISVSFEQDVSKNIATIMQNVFMRNGNVIALAHNHVGEFFEQCRFCVKVGVGKDFSGSLLEATKVCGLKFLGHLVVSGGSWEQLV